MNIGIVSCSKEKVPNSCLPARMLYSSQLAQKSLQHAERTCDEVWFISGRYGLLRPDQEISSYDDNSPIEIHYYGGASKVHWLHVLKGGIGQRLHDLTEWLR